MSKVKEKKLGKSGVEINNEERRIGREEKGRGMIEMIDRIMKLMEKKLMIRKLIGNIGKMKWEER